MKDFKLDSSQMADTQRQVDMVNKKLKAQKKNPGQPLGKDDFLKLLVTELGHQDPTNPMNDREFMAQMAQFSSLEQMKNVSDDMTKLYNISRNGEAYSLIGKKVEAFNPQSNKVTQGEVSHVINESGNLSLMINGNKVSMDHIHAVYPGQKSQNSIKSNEIINRTIKTGDNFKSSNNPLNINGSKNDNIIKAFEANSKKLSTK